MNDAETLAPPPPPREPKIIKRYTNRKLYDTQRSRYVTLDQIAEMIRDGQDVKIVDNTSKEDLTSVTLAQIIFEQEKKQNSFLPLSAMRTPLLVFPDMTLPPLKMPDPPTVLLDAPPPSSTPFEALPRASSPVTSVPMSFPSTTAPLVDPDI